MVNIDDRDSAKSDDVNEMLEFLTDKKPTAKDLRE